MTILSDRWKGLRRLPHIQLTTLPTPILHAEALGKRVDADVWVKSDDLSATPYGGNKVRKLEYILGEALQRSSDTLITMGAAGSHHAVSTAIYGAQLGQQVHVITLPQPWTSQVEAHLRALLEAGARVHPTRNALTALPSVGVLATRLRFKKRRPFVIPPGGSSVTGTLGYVEAGLELARQIESGLVPEPDVVFVPFGTGGTTAGLAVGLAAAGITARICAVRVVDRVVANRRTLDRLILSVVKRLRQSDNRFPDVARCAAQNVDLDHSQFGRGYGVATSDGRNAARLVRSKLGLELDQTYTAKTLASLIAQARGPLRGKRLLYWHTLAQSPSIGTSPRLPESLARLMVR